MNKDIWMEKATDRRYSREFVVEVLAADLSAREKVEVLQHCLAVPAANKEDEGKWVKRTSRVRGDEPKPTYNYLGVKNMRVKDEQNAREIEKARVESEFDRVAPNTNTPSPFVPDPFVSTIVPAPVVTRPANRGDFTDE